MLIDVVEVTFKGGHGGPGIVSFGAKAHSGPDGGNGGKGGDLYLEASSDLTLLNQFSQKKIFAAYDGNPGGKNKKTGKDGKDFVVYVPVGTSVISVKTGNVLVELDDKGQQYLIAKGGLGGRGNWEFRSSRRTTPEYAQPGIAGDIKKIKLNLKLIADYGLIGLPNAGKSSLLNELTNASAKVANYAFTTLSPNLGVYKGKVIADIPGLIEGASDGKGLGIGFLKHIEKTGVMIHCVSSESSDPLSDYQTVRKELAKYDESLLSKNEIILLTKSDLIDQSALNKLIKLFSKKSSVVLPISIHDWDSLEKLKGLLK